MLHDKFVQGIGAFIFLMLCWFVFETKRAKKIDERELYKTDCEKYVIEDHEDIWTKPDKKVS